MVLSFRPVAAATSRTLMPCASSIATRLSIPVRSRAAAATAGSMPISHAGSTTSTSAATGEPWKSDRRTLEVLVLPAHRVHMQRERQQSLRASCHHRTAGALCSERRKGTLQQCLETGVIVRPAGVQEPSVVEQTVAGPQHIPGAVVGRHDPPASVALKDAHPGGVEQFRQRFAQGTGIGQRLPDTKDLADVGQQTPDQVELCGRPVLPVHRVVDFQEDARAIGPLQAHVDGVSAVGMGIEHCILRRSSAPFR